MMPASQHARANTGQASKMCLRVLLTIWTSEGGGRGNGERNRANEEDASESARAAGGEDDGDGLAITRKISGYALRCLHKMLTC